VNLIWLFAPDQLSYSRPVKVTVDENTKITIEGPDRQVSRTGRAEFAASTRRNPTKAKAFVTRMSVSFARKARPSISTFMRTEQKHELGLRRRWRIRKRFTGTKRARDERVLHERKYSRAVHRRHRRRHDRGSVDDEQTTPDREKLKANAASAKTVGTLAAQAALAKGSKRVFDRGGARYHGKSKRWRMPREKPV